MAQFIAEPTPADLLDIFGPNSFVPIPLPVINGLLERLLLALPGYAGSGAEQQQSLRRLTMYELAAWMPGDVAEASIAATLVALNAQAMDCFRRAALPEIGAETALREARQANSLLRTMATGRRELERRQTARRKAEDNPTERGGYFAIKYESVAPGFVAPTPNAPANEAGAAGQALVPPKPQPAKTELASAAPKPEPVPAASPATTQISVSASEVIERFKARQTGPGENSDQVWEQCVQDAYEAAAQRAASRDNGAEPASAGSPGPLHAKPRRGEPEAKLAPQPHAQRQTTRAA